MVVQRDGRIGVERLEVPGDDRCPFFAAQPLAPVASAGFPSPGPPTVFSATSRLFRKYSGPAGGLNRDFR
jgi:hypothetical protein